MSSFYRRSFNLCCRLADCKACRWSRTWGELVFLWGDLVGATWTCATL